MIMPQCQEFLVLIMLLKKTTMQVMFMVMIILWIKCFVLNFLGTNNGYNPFIVNNH
jgi:hypothetical protein